MPISLSHHCSNLTEQTHVQVTSDNTKLSRFTFYIITNLYFSFSTFVFNHMYINEIKRTLFLLLHKNDFTRIVMFELCDMLNYWVTTGQTVESDDSIMKHRLVLWLSRQGETVECNDNIKQECLAVVVLCTTQTKFCQKIA